MYEGCTVYLIVLVVWMKIGPCLFKTRDYVKAFEIGNNNLQYWSFYILFLGT